MKCCVFIVYRVKSVPPEHEIDFTDRAYQVQLPIHARSTASQAVKNNIRITELMADPNPILAQQKVSIASLVPSIE